MTQPGQQPIRLFTPRFFTTYLLCVAITAFLPAGQSIAPDGTAVPVRVYEQYIAMFTEPGILAMRLVLLHLAACFILSLAVRWSVLRSLTRRQE